MLKEVLDEREFELINIIGSDLTSNQRELSRQMSRSLGMTNMLIRRLVNKGYIRISQLNQRKVKYILTPKGFTEKLRKSVKYTLKTINSIGVINDRIKQIITKLYEKGERDFIVLGKSDFALLIEMVLKDMPINDYKIKYVDSIPDQKIEGTLLICKEDVIRDKKYQYPKKTVDLIHELAKDNCFVNYNGD